MTQTVTDGPVGEVIAADDLIFDEDFRERARRELSQIPAVAQLYGYAAQEGVTAD